MKTLLPLIVFWQEAHRIHSRIFDLAWVQDAILPFHRSLQSAYSYDVLHPIGLPRLATIRRVCLLPVTRCRSDVGPEEARPNRLSVERIITVESTHAIVEGSFHRRIQRSEGCSAVEPPDLPLLGFRVEGPQSDTAMGAPGTLSTVSSTLL